MIWIAVFFPCLKTCLLTKGLKVILVDGSLKSFMNQGLFVTGCKIVKHAPRALVSSCSSLNCGQIDVLLHLSYNLESVAVGSVAQKPT